MNGGLMTDKLDLRYDVEKKTKGLRDLDGLSIDVRGGLIRSDIYTEDTTFPDTTGECYYSLESISEDNKDLPIVCRTYQIIRDLDILQRRHKTVATDYGFDNDVTETEDILTRCFDNKFYWYTRYGEILTGGKGKCTDGVYTSVVNPNYDRNDPNSFATMFEEITDYPKYGCDLEVAGMLPYGERSVIDEELKVFPILPERVTNYGDSNNVIQYTVKEEDGTESNSYFRDYPMSEGDTYLRLIDKTKLINGTESYYVYPNSLSDVSEVHQRSLYLPIGYNMYLEDFVSIPNKVLTSADFIDPNSEEAQYVDSVSSQIVAVVPDKLYDYLNVTVLPFKVYESDGTTEKAFHLWDTRAVTDYRSKTDEWYLRDETKPWKPVLNEMGYGNIDLSNSKVTLYDFVPTKYKVGESTDTTTINSEETAYKVPKWMPMVDAIYVLPVLGLYMRCTNVTINRQGTPHDYIKEWSWDATFDIIGGFSAVDSRLVNLPQSAKHVLYYYVGGDNPPYLPHNARYEDWAYDGSNGTTTEINKGSRYQEPFKNEYPVLANYAIPLDKTKAYEELKLEPDTYWGYEYDSSDEQPILDKPKEEKVSIGMVSGKFKFESFGFWGGKVSLYKEDELICSYTSGDEDHPSNFTFEGSIDTYGTELFIAGYGIHAKGGAVEPICSFRVTMDDDCLLVPIKGNYYCTPGMRKVQPPIEPIVDMVYFEQSVWIVTASNIYVSAPGSLTDFNWRGSAGAKKLRLADDMGGRILWCTQFGGKVAIGTSTGVWVIENMVAKQFATLPLSPIKPLVVNNKLFALSEDVKKIYKCQFDYQSLSLVTEEYSILMPMEDTDIDDWGYVDGTFYLGDRYIITYNEVQEVFAMSKKETDEICKFSFNGRYYTSNKGVGSMAIRKSDSGLVKTFPLTYYGKIHKIAIYGRGWTQARISFDDSNTWQEFGPADSDNLKWYYTYASSGFRDNGGMLTLEFEFEESDDFFLAGIQYVKELKKK